MGGLLGPVALFLVPEYFRFFGPYRELLYGTVLLGALVLAPDGLAGVGNKAAEAVMRRVRKVVKWFAGTRA